LSRSQPSEVQSTVHQIDLPLQSYENFTIQQKKREREWQSQRDAKRAKEKSSAQHVVANQKIVSSNHRDCLQEDAITLLRQQLASRTEECRELRLKLESIEATNARILTNQLEMQETFVKVIYSHVGRRSLISQKITTTIIGFYLQNDKNTDLMSER